MNSPLISIITVCKNSGSTIKDTIESVLSQTYKNFEYIIKDGGSTDRTLEIISEYEGKFNKKLHLIESSDRNMYDAMNQGIEKCSGDIIGILNSDDFYSNDALEKVADVFQNSLEKNLVVIGNLARVDNNGNTVHVYDYTEEMIKKKEAFGHPSMFVAKAVYEKIGKYECALTLAADAEWQYRMYEDKDITVRLLPDVLNNMRAGGASDSFKNRWKWFKERTRIQLQYKKGFPLKIIGRELFQVLIIDLKNLIPEKYQEKLYKVRYKEHNEEY